MHQAVELIERYCGTRIVEKTRYRVRHGAHTFEVDVFEGRHRGLVVAEIELDHPEQEVDLPDWIGTELTGDKRYSNHWLARFSEVPDRTPPDLLSAAKIAWARQRRQQRRRRARHGRR